MSRAVALFVVALCFYAESTIPVYQINVSNEAFAAFGVARDTTGNVYYSDNTYHTINKVDPTSVTLTPVVIAGTSGTSGNTGDNGPAVNARFFSPHMMHVDVTNKLLIADYDNAVVRKINLANGIISLVAGNYVRTSLGAGDGGPATSASLHGPQCPWSDTSNNVYISDSLADKIYRIDATSGIIDFVIPYDLSAPNQIWGDSTNSYLYVAQVGGHVVTRYALDTYYYEDIAGIWASSGSTGDGGFAYAAKLNKPRGVWGDSAGNVYIVDSYNDVIRRVDGSTGIINRISGTYGTSSRTGDNGPALSATHTVDMKQIVGNGVDSLHLAEQNTVRLMYSATAAPTSYPTTPSRYPTSQPSMLCRPNVTETEVKTTVVTTSTTTFLN